MAVTPTSLLSCLISIGKYEISVGLALLFLWIAGAVCRFFVQAVEYIHLVHMIGKCPGYFKHDMESVIRRIDREFGKSGRFKTLLVPGIKTPAIFGMVHPKILMPATDYTEGEIYYILKHEILHYYQHDMLIKILCEILCTVFWWNPAVFLLKKQITRVLEVRVDCLLTAGFSDEEKISYMECIVKSMKAGGQEKTSLMITFATQKGEAMKRRFGCIWENERQQERKRNTNIMRNSLAWKTLLRSPVKSLLTFLLIAAASFALFSRVTDYAVIRREAANAESFYHGVAALDNTVPEMLVHWEEDGITYCSFYEPENNPWPTEEQLAEFSSLPGVTLTDTRYMTAGLVEGCKRVVDEAYGEYGESAMGLFVLEGTYGGYENWSENGLYLMFDDVMMLAGECGISNGDSVKINHLGIEEFAFSHGEQNPYPQEFWDQLEKGSRVLIKGQYWGSRYSTAGGDGYDENVIRVLDGLGEDYLETEEFAYYKELIEVINQDLAIYDIVYTSDMRSIPRFNERKMVMEKGRPLAAEDTDACVVSELFLETYGLTIGDKINVKLGDRLFSQEPLYGATSIGSLKRTSDFVDEAELEIVGAYRFVDNLGARRLVSAWSYSQSTIFVPDSLLAIEVPDDYVPSIGEFSVLIEDASDIETFKEAAEPLAAKMGVALCFSDGGWLSVKDSFEMGALTSFLTTVLYAIGAALALLLAAYLYVGRNKESYAVMRAMGVPGRMAGRTLVLPLATLAAFAIPVGGAAGLFYTSKATENMLAVMADSAADVYVPDAALPIGVVMLCLLFELTFIASVTLVFLRKMKKTPPLELLQGDVLWVDADKKAAPDKPGQAFIPTSVDITKLSAAGEMKLSSRRKYGALRQVTAYVLHHMRRSIWKSAVSLALTAVLVSGVGMLALSRVAYQDAFYEIDVNAAALDFVSSNIVELSKSDLVQNLYCYDTFGVRTNGQKLNTRMVFTNDLGRYLTDDHIKYTAVYADGYDISALDDTKPVCMVGEALAAMLGISPGDEVALLSDSRYAALASVYEEEGEAMTAAEREAVMYKVIGIIESADETAGTGIFAGINGPMEDVYSQPFPFGYCECTLVDNEKLDELSLLLMNLKNTDGKYSPMASFYIDSEAFEDILRVRSLLEALFPIAVMAALLIGLTGYGLVILQSAKEAAFLRILGVTKKRARCMLTLEQVLLCMIGIVLVAGGLALYDPGIFARSAQTIAICYTLYFMGCLCGASAAAVQVTRHRVLELLQVKE